MSTAAVGTGTAIGLSVTMRLATVLGDGLAFVVGYSLKWLTEITGAQRRLGDPS